MEYSTFKKIKKIISDLKNKFSTYIDEDNCYCLVDNQGDMLIKEKYIDIFI